MEVLGFILYIGCAVAVAVGFWAKHLKRFSIGWSVFFLVAPVLVVIRTHQIWPIAYYDSTYYD